MKLKSVYMVTDMEGCAGVDDWIPATATTRPRRGGSTTAPRSSACSPAR